MRSAVILAGGQSSRMGSEKCTALLAGKPLIAYTYLVLKQLADEIVVSVSQEAVSSSLLEAFGGEVRFVGDSEPFEGPLNGILSSFKNIKGDFVAVAPCDSPFIELSLYSRLFELAVDTEAAVPMVGGRWEPLHAVYRRDAMVEAAEKVLAGGKHRMIDTFENLDIRTVTEDEVRELDTDMLSFFNINTKNDLLEAHRITGSEGGKSPL